MMDINDAVDFASAWLKPLIKDGNLSNHSVEPGEYSYVFGLQIQQGVDDHPIYPTFYKVPDGVVQYLYLKSGDDKAAYDTLKRITASRILRGEDINEAERFFIAGCILGKVPPPTSQRSRLAKTLAGNVLIIFLARKIHESFGFQLFKNDTTADARSVCDIVSIALERHRVYRTPRAIKDLLTHESSRVARDIVDEIINIQEEQRRASEKLKLDIPTAFPKIY